MPRKLIVSIVMGIIGGCLIYFAYRIAHKERDFAPYYQQNISPLIDAADARDKDATTLAITRLHEHFQVFHSGIPAFTEDITSWGTRFGIVGRAVKDLWTRLWSDKSKATSVCNYTDRVFRAHVVSPETLKKAIDQTLATFNEAMAASHNRLEAEIKLIIGRPDCPLKLPEVQINDCFGKARSIALEAGIDSVKMGTFSVVGSTLVGDLVGAIAGRLAASASIRALPASVLATIGGAEGGSAAGPIGTVVGLGVGFAVGTIVDMWMTATFKEKLAAQMNEFLDNLEKDLTKGVDGKPGLRTLLEGAASSYNERYRNALFEELRKAPLP